MRCSSTTHTEHKSKQLTYTKTTSKKRIRHPQPVNSRDCHQTVATTDTAENHLNTHTHIKKCNTILNTTIHKFNITHSSILLHPLMHNTLTLPLTLKRTHTTPPYSSYTVLALIRPHLPYSHPLPSAPITSLVQVTLPHTLRPSHT